MRQGAINDYGLGLRERLGGRVQKIAIDAGLSCPNRDGRLSTGGCTFCRGDAFSPDYCRTSPSIAEQIDRGIRFHAARRRTASQYLAYFQAGTNTYAPISKLEQLYNEALAHPAIGGIIVGTRPDCISSEILDLLEHISTTRYVAVEYGIESVYDTTLTHVNRGHDFASAVDAIAQTKTANIDVGAHFILGLPNETTNDILAGIHHINALGIDFIKFHQLQIYRNTAMEREWREHPERFLFGMQSSTEEYADLLIEIIRRLDPRIAIERLASQAPRNLIVHSPLKGIRPHELRDMVVNRMLTENLRQGDLYPFAL